MVKKRGSPPPRYREVYGPPEESRMTRPCGIKCCKYFLLAVNFIFLLTGLTILGLGVWMLVSEKANTYMEILNDTSCDECMVAVKYFKIPYVLMCIGGAVTMLSFLGCCGSWTESTCLLCLYSLTLAIILMAEIACTIFIGVYKDKITTCLDCSMTHQVQYLYNNTRDYPRLPGANETHLLTQAWDLMQTELKCCGSSGPEDYYLSAWYNYTHPRIGVNVPRACCKLVRNSDQEMASRLSCQGEANHLAPPPQDSIQFLKTKGCHDALLDWLRVNVTIAVVVLTAVIILQIMDLVAACLFLSRIRTEQSTHRYMPPGSYPM